MLLSDFIYNEINYYTLCISIFLPIFVAVNKRLVHQELLYKKSVVYSSNLFFPFRKSKVVIKKSCLGYATESYILFKFVLLKNK